ncbi:MAG: FHA domain-containing protein [bacterium]
MLKMVLKFQGHVLKEIESDQDEITIGRNEDNHIRIDNMAVSGDHARIIKNHDDYYIEDLRSTNGTFVNEEKIRKRILNEHDEITIGKHTLLITSTGNGKGHQGVTLGGIEKTWRLETEQYKEMLKRQTGSE